VAVARTDAPPVHPTMLTVRELLRDLDVHLRAGAESLDAPVRWVHISELEDPTPWLSGGELLLTTGLQLGDEATQRAFVGRLADHNLAGLGFGAGFAHESVPAAMIEVAEERGFPIVEIPYEVPFIAVTEQAFSRLVNEQYAVLRRAISAHERLERLLLSQRGLDAVAGALSSLIGAAVVILDGRGEPRVRRAFREPLEDEAVEALALEVRERMRAGERRSFVPGQTELAGRGLALPVAPEESSGVPQAWLVAVKEQGGLSEFDRLVLHQAVTIVALELLRRRVAEDTERRLAGDVLSAMVSGELAGPELVRRLEPFGLAHQVAALVIARPQPGRSGLLAGEHALSSALRAEAVDGLVASTGDWICALLPGGDDDELFSLTQRIGTRVQEELGVPVRAGAGRSVEGAQGRRSFHEARCALEARQLARTNGNGNGVATYKDLGSFQLLLSLQEDDALKLFCDSVLGPIETSEGAYGGELMRSLEAFIEENGQWERAAKRLYCHRHTLRYRVRKVEELTGRDLSSAQDRIEFWLALRGRELVT
jgi:purine catabolism regulator